MKLLVKVSLVLLIVLSGHIKATPFNFGWGLCCVSPAGPYMCGVGAPGPIPLCDMACAVPAVVKGGAKTSSAAIRIVEQCLTTSLTVNQLSSELGRFYSSHGEVRQKQHDQRIKGIQSLIHAISANETKLITTQRELTNVYINSVKQALEDISLQVKVNKTSLDTLSQRSITPYSVDYSELLYKQATLDIKDTFTSQKALQQIDNIQGRDALLSEINRSADILRSLITGNSMPAGVNDKDVLSVINTLTDTQPKKLALVELYKEQSRSSPQTQSVLNRYVVESTYSYLDVTALKAHQNSSEEGLRRSLTILKQRNNNLLQKYYALKNVKERIHAVSN